MAQDSIILLEVSVDNFEHAWKRFRLAAVAKQWQEEKQLQILPILLRGNLVDYYMDLGDDEKKLLEEVKQALERKAGILKDPIVAAKYFGHVLLQKSHQVPQLLLHYFILCVVPDHHCHGLDDR